MGLPKDNDMSQQQGPEVKLELSCRGCEHLDSECEHDEQGDRSWCYYCDHPDTLADLGVRAYIGYHTRTPPACPLRAVAIAAAVKRLGFVPEEELQKLFAAWRQSWDCSADPGHSIMEAAIAAAGLHD